MRERVLGSRGKNQSQVPSETTEPSSVSHSYICCLVHVVFSTAQRRPLISEQIRDRLHAYLGGIARENGMAAIAVGGVADHVHILLSLPRTNSVAKAVQLLKGGSSKWLNDNFTGPGQFAWQEGYGAFSIGISQREKTVAYIKSQADHHKRITFAEEFAKFLVAHGITEETNSVVPAGT